MENMVTVYDDEFKPFFRDIHRKPPELKTIEEIEVLDQWKQITYVERLFLLSSFLDWLIGGLVICETEETVFRKKWEYTNKKMRNTWNDEIFRIDRQLYEFQTRAQKLNFLNRELANINQLPTVDIFAESDIRKYLLEEIKYWENYLDEPTPDTAEQEQGTIQKNKIKWRGSPALFGYIFTELLKHDYFDPPKRAGDINYTGFAKLCWEHFEIDTTLENLIREMNPEKNSLSEAKRAKFPDLSDLG